LYPLPLPAASWSARRQARRGLTWHSGARPFGAARLLTGGHHPSGWAGRPLLLEIGRQKIAGWGHLKRGLPGRLSAGLPALPCLSRSGLVRTASCSSRRRNRIFRVWLMTGHTSQRARAGAKSKGGCSSCGTAEVAGATPVPPVPTEPRRLVCDRKTSSRDERDAARGGWGAVSQRERTP
jgi:hypothetical protein